MKLLDFLTKEYQDPFNEIELSPELKAALE
jgi:hypothetical protein